VPPADEDDEEAAGEAACVAVVAAAAALDAVNFADDDTSDDDEELDDGGGWHERSLKERIAAAHARERRHRDAAHPSVPIGEIVARVSAAVARVPRERYSEEEVARARPRPVFRRRGAAAVADVVVPRVPATPAAAAAVSAAPMSSAPASVPVADASTSGDRDAARRKRKRDLEEAKELFEGGLISEEDYVAKKRQIIGL